MIITKRIKVKSRKNNISYYENLGYIQKDGVFDIEVTDLQKNSHSKIVVKCDMCDNIKEISYRNYLKNTKNLTDYYSCSNKCSNKKRKDTNKQKYGVDWVQQNKGVKEKSINTMLEKYGVEHILQSDEYIKIVKEKLIENGKDNRKKRNKEKYDKEDITDLSSYDKYKITNFKKYGVSHPSKSPEIKEKTKQTNIDKYGYSNHMKTEKSKEMMSSILKNKSDEEKLETRNKWEKTMLDIYGEEYNKINNKKSLKKIKNNTIDKYKKLGLLDIDYTKKEYKFYCDTCNEFFYLDKYTFKNRRNLNTEFCTVCNPINSGSDKENKLYDFINDNYNGEIQRNVRKVLDNKYELDIYLPDLNLAFEFNGIYWHNELYKEKNYHKDKTDLCEKNGIQLIHVWEDDWLYKREIVESMIINKLYKNVQKIFARKCQMKEVVDNNLVRTFLDNNHIQGFVGSSIKLGLYYEGELVSLMIFGKKRKMMNSKSKEGEYELLRFCNKLNTSVIGGASKLFKYFTINYNYTEILTYADRSHSNGNLYKTLGFDYVSKTQPNYHYVIGDHRYHRFGFRKDVLVKEGFDPNKTEHEIMLERKIYRIYNSGNLKYVYKKKDI